MKNRVLTIILAIAVTAAAMFFVFFSGNIGISFGYFLDTNGGAMLITKDGSPISLNSSDDEDFYDFAGIKDGEKLLVFHDGINETYPASTHAHYIIPLGGASPDNIPKSTIISLTGLGWLDAEE